MGRFGPPGWLGAGMSPAAKVRLRGSQLRARLSTGRSLPVGPARACLASPLPARLGSGPGPRRPLGQALACGCPPLHASLVVAPHLVGQRGVSFRPFYCCGRTDQQPTCALPDSSHVVSFAVGFSGWPRPSAHPRVAASLSPSLLQLRGCWGGICPRRSRL